MHEVFICAIKCQRKSTFCFHLIYCPAMLLIFLLFFRFHSVWLNVVATQFIVFLLVFSQKSKIKIEQTKSHNQIILRKTTILQIINYLFIWALGTKRNKMWKMVGYWHFNCTIVNQQIKNIADNQQFCL